MSLLLSLSLLALLVSSITALPRPTPTSASFSALSSSIAPRQYVAGVSQPWWPDDIASCVACQPEWSGISSCAAAAPAFENWMNMLYNPLSFIDAIQCACTDTFSSAYPQCVDCFVQTNQCEQFLGVPSEQNASSVLNGIRQICGLGSVLLSGNGAAASQSAAGSSYTYNGVPNQGYPTTTSIGVGGIDYGSQEGAKSGASGRRVKGGLVVVATAVVGGVLVALWGL